MKLAIIIAIITSLGFSLDLQARESDRKGARKSSPPSASKSYKPRTYKRDDSNRRFTQQRPSRKMNTTPPQRIQRPKPNNNAYNSNRSSRADQGRGFGSPKQSITNQKPYKQSSDYRKPARSYQSKPERDRQSYKPNERRQDRNYSKPRVSSNDSRAIRETSPNRNITKPDRATTREIQGGTRSRDSLRPSDRSRTNDRARASTRLPEAMPLRRHTESNKGNAQRYNNGRSPSIYRENKRDNFRYQQHRWLVNKQKHRRHSISMPRQLERYRNNHYRGKHHYGNWHRGHNHYHYDYRYRYLYNPYQWYDDYYYHAYFNWRWYHPHHWHMSGYYGYYMDPYYCPDDFHTFIATLAVGALILSW